MGIFTRFRDIISSNINAMLDKAEDPEKLIKLMIREMEDTLVEIKTACAGVMASGKKVQRQLEGQEARAQYWEEKAQLAVKKGRDDLAREALVEKRKFTRRAESLEHDLVEQDLLNLEGFHVLGVYHSKEVYNYEPALEKVAENPVTLHDLHATILHLLGFDHETLTFFHNGRDERLTDVAGKVVQGEREFRRLVKLDDIAARRQTIETVHMVGTGREGHLHPSRRYPHWHRRRRRGRRSLGGGTRATH